MLSDLRGEPTWYINCTIVESGKRFRFCRDNMGDYTIGYVEKPEIPVSEVMAASAGFPVLIGPYSLNTKDYHWAPYNKEDKAWRPPADQTLHLWDGGVYDNLGLESVFKLENGQNSVKDVDDIIVSNASASIGHQERKTGLSVKNLKRLLDISMDQVVALRTREVMDYITRTGRGMYIKIGNSAEKITTDSGCTDETRGRLIAKCLPAEQARKALYYATTLSKPSSDDMQTLLRHGYEVVKCTYDCYRNTK
jgi:NTE family protein